MKLKKSENLFLIFSLAFLFFLISTVNAEEIKVVKQNTADSLVRGCWNNGTFCSSLAVCKSTIVNPDGRIVVHNATELNAGTFFNLSLPTNATGIIGTYNVIRSCTDTGGSINGSAADSYQFIVTPSGSDDSTIGYIMLLGFGFALSLLMIMFGYFRQDARIVLFGSIVLVFVGLWSLLNGIGNYRNDLTFAGSLATLGLGAYISIRASMEMIDE